MEIGRVLVAMGNEATNTKIKIFMIENGYEVVDQAVEGNECLRKISKLKPDLLVLDSTLPAQGGYEVAKVAIEDWRCEVVMICAQGQEMMWEDLNESLSLTCLHKPLNKILLLNTLDIISKSKRKLKKLEKEIDALKSTIDSRKEVDKAKNLLMQHLNMSEQEAFKRIQKQSMDKGMPMKEIAKAIILAYDI